MLATSIGNPELDVFAMLERAGLPYAVDAAWTEATPLGRAEWVKFTASFFNREAEANRLFDGIAARYEELRAIARTVERRPTVLVGTPFQGTWHVSGGAAYQARLIADAGGAYLWADDPTTGSIPLDFESVYARGLDAEVWIHPYGWHSLADGIKADERMADFAAWKSGRVYNNDARINGEGGNDYWETGSLRPDLILADLIEILHPGAHRPPARVPPPAAAGLIHLSDVARRLRDGSRFSRPRNAWGTVHGSEPAGTRASEVVVWLALRRVWSSWNRRPRRARSPPSCPKASRSKRRSATSAISRPRRRRSRPR